LQLFVPRETDWFGKTSCVGKVFDETFCVVVWFGGCPLPLSPFVSPVGGGMGGFASVGGR